MPKAVNALLQEGLAGIYNLEAGRELTDTVRFVHFNSR
jgi:hypothetical protein